MHSDIHRKLIKKMALGCLLLSLLIGGIAGFAELERIDHFVVGLAHIDSTRLTEAYHAYFDHPSTENKIRLDELASNSVHDQHFVLAEVYDIDRQKVLERTLANAHPVIKELESRQHSFLMGDKVEYQRFFSDGRIYLKIVTPIIHQDEEKRIIGYFEGMYQVSDEKMREIGLWLLWSVMQTVLAISLTTIILYPVIIALNNDLIKRSLDLSDANLGMLKVLGNAVAKRDSDTNAHNFRVTIYAIRLAEALRVGAKEIKALIKGAFLHDLGKIGISDTILLKPGKLSPEEFDTMKHHVRHGVDIISHYAWLNDALDVVRYHHEKFDGSGYQEGLAADNIPLGARIFAIADVFDALTSKRPYKEPFSFEKSMAILEESSNSHFDPEMIEAFKKIAHPLYDLLSGNEEEAVLNTHLDKLIRQYF